MKFEECKIGDIVTPKTDKIKTYCFRGGTSYIALAKEFIITELNRATKTVDITSTDPKNDTVCLFVYPSCLNPANSDKFSMSEALHGKIITPPQTPDYKLDFEVRREKNELSAYYHGVKLATVRCHPDDTYDEEFGLHLLLRRACLKLKDEHTVVETVEELLQKP
jgi:hypothetical protein